MARWRARVAMGWALAGVLAVPQTARAMQDDAQLGTEASVAALEPRAQEPEAPRVRAVRRDGRVVIDGVASEQAWAAAPPQRALWQRNPHEGAPPRFDTEFRVLYDDEALYVSVKAYDPEPARIRSLLTKRDEASASDWVWVAIDSYADRRTAFMFGLNPAGVQRDLLLYGDTLEDASWDAVWDGAAAIHEDGWGAEFRIPFNQLRFSAGTGDAWGLQVSRLVQRTREESMWAPWPRDSGQRVSLFGRLEGVEGIMPSRRLELLPYALSGLAAGESALPGARELGGTGSVGLDLAYGLGSNFTLTGTLNPDFGQVEADPAEVNLGTRETFFQEKRPFFLEGMDLFRFGLEQRDELFYSRRIGARPHGPGAGPKHTTIYGAAKLSGKTAGGWSIGVLDALTAEARAADPAAGQEIGQASEQAEARIVEPLTNYTVARVSKDMNAGRTSMGGMVTAVHRRLGDAAREDMAPLRAMLHDQAYAGGLSLDHRLASNAWQVSAKLVGSYVHGSPEAIARTQRASQRYFQRADAAHLHYDPTRTSLAGVGGTWSVGKIAGGDWRMVMGGDLRSPGLELNDLGFHRESDYYLQYLTMQRRHDAPGRLLRSWRVTGTGWSGWNTAAEPVARGGSLSSLVTLTSYWSAYAGLELSHALQDAAALRGSATLRGEPWYGSWLEVGSDTRKRVYGSFLLVGTASPGSDSWRVRAEALANIQARSNLQLALGPASSRRVDDLQYVTRLQDDAGQSHDILARIDHVTVALTLRLSYTLSPTLGLQLYAQPFVSTGRYEDYKEVVAPRAPVYSERFHVFRSEMIRDAPGMGAIDLDGNGEADLRFRLADFSVRRVRASAVLRWIYRPGSTLSLIWSHDRSSTGSEGDFDLIGNLGELAQAPGEHLVLLKLSHWLGL